MIKDRTYNFALRIIELYQKLKTQNEYALSNQLVRAGTSIGANVEEATAAQSKRDFIAKMSIASKEARETRYWLKLIRDSKLCNDIDISDLIKESDELVKIITKIVKTSKENTDKSSK